MNKTGKKIIGVFFTMCMLLMLLPTAVWAAPTGVTLIVNPSSPSADDSNARADGAIYKTLQAAVAAAADDDIIAVAENITLTSKVYVGEKHITITSSDAANPVTISRGAGFATSVDGSRPNGYNPAMFEVAVAIVNTPSDSASSLRLEHIILDDKALNEKDPTSTVDQLKNWQDGMIAVYGLTIDSTSGRVASVVLGSGAVLRNWGGSSAVVATEYGRVIMEDGSVIEDTMPAASWPAGHGQAILLASAALDMQKGSVIQNIVASGHGVYVDSGTAVVDGTIKGLRGSTSTNGSGNAIQTRGNGTVLTIGENGLITDNYSWRGAVSLWGYGLSVTVKGTVDNNHSTDRGGGISTADYGSGTITLKPGCKITNNTCQETGGGLYISPSGTQLIMEGGEISGNRSGVNQDGTTNSGQMGGGIAIRKYGDTTKVLLQGGIICNNIATGVGGGVGMDSGCGITNILPAANSTVVIKDNLQYTGESNDVGMTTGVTGRTNYQHLHITTDSTLGNNWIYLGGSNKYVSLRAEAPDLSIANVSSGIETRFAAEAAALAMNKLAALWVNTPSDATSFNITKPTGSVEGLPFYVLTMPTAADGTVDTSAKPTVSLAAVNADGSLKVAFPNSSAAGYAVAIAQLITDYGTFAITGPAELNSKTDGTDYEIPYSAAFTATEDMLDIITARGANGTYQFTIQLDSRMTPKKNGADCDCTLTSDVFAADASSVVISGSNVTFTCTLKSGWENALTASAPLFTAELTGVLPNASFSAGKYLNTTGNVTFSMTGTGDIIIPANLCQTLMKDNTPVAGSYTIPTVNKVVNGTMPGGKIFEFTISGVKTGGGTAPTPDSGMIAISRTGAGTLSFGTLTFTSAGEYVYTIKETAGSDTGCTYDPAVYTLTLTVDEVSGKYDVTAAVLTASRTQVVDGGGAELLAAIPAGTTMSAITFTNIFPSIYTNTHPPKTGDTNVLWLYAGLCMASAFALAGTALFMGKNKRKEL